MPLWNWCHPGWVVTAVRGRCTPGARLPTRLEAQGCFLCDLHAHKRTHTRDHTDTHKRAHTHTHTPLMFRESLHL